jgi:hypothetical protein
MQSELYKEYQTKVIPALSKSHGYKNVFEVPKVHKVVVNTCIPAQGADLKQALDHGAEAGRNEIEEEHFQLQIAEGPGHRGKSDFAW